MEINIIDNLNQKKLNFIKINKNFLKLKKIKFSNNVIINLMNLNNLAEKKFKKLNMKQLYSNLTLNLLKKIFFNKFKLILINNIYSISDKLNKSNNLILIKNKLLLAVKTEVSSIGNFFLKSVISFLNLKNFLNLNNLYEINSVKIFNKIYYNLKFKTIRKKIFSYYNFFLPKYYNLKLINLNLINFLFLLNYYQTFKVEKNNF